MSGFDAFAWERWEDCIDYALAMLERYDDDDHPPGPVTWPLATAVGWHTLHDWGQFDHEFQWRLAGCARASTAGEQRAALRRLRFEVARQSQEPCPGCGLPVWPGKKGRVYCSNACRQRSYRERRGNDAAPAVTRGR